MRHRVRIDENTGTTEGSSTYYAKTEDWTEYMTVQAEIDSGTSREFWAAKQRHDELTHIIRIWWRPDFDVTKDELRFVWTDLAEVTHTVYAMGRPTNIDNRNRVLEFHCIEHN